MKASKEKMELKEMQTPMLLLVREPQKEMTKNNS